MPDSAAGDIYPDTPTRPPFDPELAPLPPMIREVIPPFSAETLEATRAMSRDGIPGLEPVDLTAGGAVRVEERQVPGPEGAPDVTVLILSPTKGEGLRAGIYHTHGGGMVVGDRRTGVELFLPYVAEGLAVVVSVEYRLAPEHPDPAPIEDCYAGCSDREERGRAGCRPGPDPDRRSERGRRSRRRDCAPGSRPGPATGSATRC